MREIGYVVGLDSMEEVQDLLSRLADRGYLLQDAGWWRMLRLTERGWRLAKESDAAAEAKGFTLAPANLTNCDGSTARHRDL